MGAILQSKVQQVYKTYSVMLLDVQNLMNMLSNFDITCGIK